MRDARILPIYEGTNGIQALDLVGRKLLKQGDATLRGIIEEIRQLSAGMPEANVLEARRLLAGAELLASATSWVVKHSTDDPNTVSAIAYNYLMLTGTVVGGWLLTRHAVAAKKNGEKGAESYAQTARFYLEQIMPRAQSYAAAVETGGLSIIDFPETMF